jgi:hypothetical protein
MTETKKLFVTFDGMCWPATTDDTGNLEYRMRFAPKTLTESDLLVCASIMNAYRYLVWLPQKTRNDRISKIRKLSK